MPNEFLNPLGLSVEQAAQLAGISRAKLYAYLMSGECPSIKFGRRRVVPVDGLRRWLAELSESERGGRK